jgi:uncharacterized protein YndB with AHSA1/START domain
MERKTKIKAEDNQQSLLITRDFDLPVELLFRAHVDPDIFEEWMTHEYGKVKVMGFEMKRQGSWGFQNSDPTGQVVFRAHGTIHDVVPNKKIVRTFEMENSPFDVQLEFLEFESLSEDTSRLNMHSIYRTVALRDQMLKLPFAQGLNMAHDRLEKVLIKLK